MTTWLLEVTDLKQYTYCPRIVFYRYCLPRVRPITSLMKEGIQSHVGGGLARGADEACGLTDLVDG